MSQPALTARHNAPAGVTYTSVRHAGRTMMKEMFPGFLNGTSNAIIPPLFINALPEEVGEDGKIVPGPNIGPTKLKGPTHWKRGEDLEVIIYRRFEQMFSSNSFSECQMLWKGLTIDGFKTNALVVDHPESKERVSEFCKNYTKKNAKILGEADFVVFVTDV